MCIYICTYVYANIYIYVRLYRDLWGLGFAKIRVTILEVPKIRMIVIRCLYQGPPMHGNFHVKPTA